MKYKLYSMKNYQKNILANSPWLAGKDEKSFDFWLE